MQGDSQGTAFAQPQSREDTKGAEDIANTEYLIKRRDNYILAADEDHLKAA